MLLGWFWGNRRDFMLLMYARWFTLVAYKILYHIHAGCLWLQIFWKYIIIISSWIIASINPFIKSESFHVNYFSTMTNGCCSWNKLVLHMMKRQLVFKFLMYGTIFQKFLRMLHHLATFRKHCSLFSFVILPFGLLVLSKHYWTAP